jgi:hypothetical protein
MAKQLTFQIDSKDHPCDINRLDRKKLYGWKDTVAFDSQGNECIRVDIDETGSFIIPKGGKALGSIDMKGKWVDKSDLKAVDLSGKPAVLSPSSFESPIMLENTVDIETFLDHLIDAVYIIEPADDIKASLIKIIQAADGIFSFSFNYRPDYDPKTAFLIEAQNTIFMLAGTSSDFEYIGLEQMADLNVSEDEEDFSIEDDLDFSMM